MCVVTYKEFIHIQARASIQTYLQVHSGDGYLRELRKLEQRAARWQFKRSSLLSEGGDVVIGEVDVGFTQLLQCLYQGGSFPPQL